MTDRNDKFVWGHREQYVGELKKHRLPEVAQDAKSLDTANSREKIDLSLFPSTRFYGSKKKQLNWLSPYLGALNGSSVLDAFGGTGTVSLLFGVLGKSVSFNDVFRFNEISARALFLKDGDELTLNTLQSTLREVRPTSGFITHTFKRMFYPTAENQWLDGFMKVAGGMVGLEKDMLMYCLFQACLKKRPFNLFHRANLNIREGCSEATFGNSTTWETPFSSHILSSFKELSLARPLSRGAVKVLPGKSADMVDGQFDIVYLDPPYFARDRHTESYLLRYHFLEGLARFDEWPSLVDLDSPVRMLRTEIGASEWVSKADFAERLFSLIYRHRNSTVALSYVANATPSEYALTKYFRSIFPKVNVHTKKFRRVLSSKGRTEILLVGRA